MVTMDSHSMDVTHFEVELRGSGRLAGSQELWSKTRNRRKNMICDQSGPQSGGGQLCPGSVDSLVE